MKYIDAEKLIVKIKTRQSELVEHIKTDTPSERAIDGSKTVELQLVLDIIDSLQQDETQVDKMLCSQVWWGEQGWIMIPPDATIEGIDSLLREVKKKLQQEQPELSNEFEIAINRRLNLINGENLTATELLEETKGMAAELLDLACKVIEKEQPEVDLEKEIEKEWKECDPIDEGMGVESAYIHIEAFDIIAHRFFELGKKDMKKQMMKESVEANVIATKRNNKYQQLLITDWNGFNNLLNADKVRIIIVKEEENK